VAYGSATEKAGEVDGVLAGSVAYIKVRIAAAHGRFNRIRQVAPMCTAI